MLNIAHLHHSASANVLLSEKSIYPYSRLAEVTLGHLVGDVGAHEHPAVHAPEAFAAGASET